MIDNDLNFLSVKLEYGKENVVGVLMPDGVQPDIDYSNGLVDFLGIKNYTFNIHAATEGIRGEMQRLGIKGNLNREIKDINALYGEYQAGSDLESKAPLTNFTTEDAEPGVGRG